MIEFLFKSFPKWRFITNETSIQVSSSSSSSSTIFTAE
jgi:hypothetical protein